MTHSSVEAPSNGCGDIRHLQDKLIYAYLCTIIVVVSAG